MPGRKARLGRQLSGYLANRVALTIVLVLLVLAGLPLAVWLDLRNLSERALREQADDLSTMIDSIRNVLFQQRGRARRRDVGVPGVQF